MKKLNKKLYEADADGIRMVVKHVGHERGVPRAATLARFNNEHTDTVTEKTKPHLFDGSNEEPL